MRLRALRPADVDQFLGWAQDPELRRHYLGHMAAHGGSLDWVPRCPRRPLTGARPAGHVVRAIEAPDGRLLGWIELRDLNWRRRNGELRVCLGDARTWGRGYGTAAVRALLQQAFGTWKLRSVHLRVATWNVRAVAAYERCGFRREARLLAGRHAADGLEDLWLMTVCSFGGTG